MATQTTPNPQGQWVPLPTGGYAWVSGSQLAGAQAAGQTQAAQANAGAFSAINQQFANFQGTFGGAVSSIQGVISVTFDSANRYFGIGGQIGQFGANPYFGIGASFGQAKPLTAGPVFNLIGPEGAGNIG